jgi:hypothetical protein
MVPERSRQQQQQQQKITIILCSSCIGNAGTNKCATQP